MTLDRLNPPPPVAPLPFTLIPLQPKEDNVKPLPRPPVARISPKELVVEHGQIVKFDGSQSSVQMVGLSVGLGSGHKGNGEVNPYSG